MARKHEFKWANTQVGALPLILKLKFCGNIVKIKQNITAMEKTAIKTIKTFIFPRIRRLKLNLMNNGIMKNAQLWSIEVMKKDTR